MTQNEYAVRVKEVSKVYRLWHTKQHRLTFPFKRLLAAIVPVARFKAACQPSQYYRDFSALNEITFDVRKGESWGFIGVNGSGKSTLLKIISGNLRPTAGRVEVDGKVVILDYGSGFNGEFTGKENIFIKAALLGLTRKKIKERYQSIVDFAEIGEFINQPVKTYSSGMVSRLGFAIMAHVDADIIITDEALAVGDVFFVQKCMKFIKEFLKRGTFLFVSHSTSDVMTLCQNAVWLDHGAVKAVGPAAKVVKAYLDKRYHIRGAIEELMTEDEQVDSGVEEVGEIVLGKPVSLENKSERLALAPVHRHSAISVPSFDLDSANDTGSAEIKEIRLLDESGNSLSQMIGGEMVTLTIEAIAKQQLGSPIFVFQVLDRLGQILFTDNSYLSMIDNKCVVKQGEMFSINFRFSLPLLPPGDYVLHAAVAELSPSGGISIMHTVNNALAFRSVTTGARHGLVGIPMHSISLKCKSVATA